MICSLHLQHVLNWVLGLDFDLNWIFQVVVLIWLWIIYVFDLNFFRFGCFNLDLVWIGYEFLGNSLSGFACELIL